MRIDCLARWELERIARLLEQVSDPSIERWAGNTSERIRYEIENKEKHYAEIKRAGTPSSL